MVRLLINQPQWIFLHEAFSSLEAEEEEQMLELICKHLPEATILAISHMPNGASFYNRSLAL
jgi:vitamin B12/bleomycin/antimicrobial peptide transport system ATP-binding/permease protein